MNYSEWMAEAPADAPRMTLDEWIAYQADLIEQWGETIAGAGAETYQQLQQAIRQARGED